MNNILKFFTQIYKEFIKDYLLTDLTGFYKPKNQNTTIF